MSFTTTAYYRNFSVIPEPFVTPVPLEGLLQVAKQSDLGAASGQLTANQLMGGSLYFGPTVAGGASAWILPSGDSMMKTFGKNLDKYINTGSIVRLEVVNYGFENVTIYSGVGGPGTGGFQSQKIFADANGTGICNCLNIKFTSATGSYVIF